MDTLSVMHSYARHLVEDPRTFFSQIWDELSSLAQRLGSAAL